MVYKSLCLNRGGRYLRMVGCYRITVELEISHQSTRTWLFRISTFSKIGPIVAKLWWSKYSWPTHIILLVHSLPLSRISRSLSHNSRPLSRKSMKHRKCTIRAAQNIKNFQNRPNSRKVMLIWKKLVFFVTDFAGFHGFSCWPKIWTWYIC